MTPLQEALAPRSDQLNADDLIPGPRTIKITEARVLDAGREGKKITVRFEGDNGKPWKPCKTMGRAMVMVWGITDEEQFAGKSLTIYRDPEVAFGDQGKIGGIRISHMSHIDSAKTVKLTVSQGVKKAFVFKPLTADVQPIKQVNAPQSAEDWVAAHLDKAMNTPTSDAFESAVLRGANAVAKLARDHPDLHAKVMAAYEQRRAELNPPTASGEPDWPTDDLAY